MALIRMGDFRRAEFALQKITGKDSDSPLVLDLEAAVALGNKDPATAREKSRAALPLDPAHTLDPTTRERASTPKKALAPTTPVPLDTLAQILFAEYQLNRSRDLWERAVVLAPDAADMRYRYAVVLAKTGRRELAITELRKALESPRTFPGRRDAERLLKALDPEREQPARTG